MKTLTRIATAATGLGLMLSPIVIDGAFADPAPIACTTDANTIACTVSGTTDQPSVTLPIKRSLGVTWPTGTFPMKSGAGQMAVTDDSVTFEFYPGYLATHDAPYSYSGSFGAKADAWGVEGPFTIEVAGSTYSWNPGGYCDSDCKGKKEVATFKSAWDNGNGTVGANLVMGSDQARKLLGAVAKIEDHAGPGQYDCNGWVNEQQDDGTWANVAPIAKDKTGSDVIVTFLVEKPTAYMLSVNCKIDGSQTTYTDAGTIGGIPVQNGTKAVWADADGNGGTKPTPTPTESENSTSTPTPTPSNSSTPTATPSDSPTVSMSPTPAQSVEPTASASETPNDPSETLPTPSSVPETTPPTTPRPDQTLNPSPDAMPSVTTAPSVSSSPSPSATPESGLTPGGSVTPTPSASTATTGSSSITASPDDQSDIFPTEVVPGAESAGSASTAESGSRPDRPALADTGSSAPLAVGLIALFFVACGVYLMFFDEQK